MADQPAPRAEDTTASSEAPDPRRWRALAVCLVAGFMALLDVSIVNVALPSIQGGLDASSSDLQWVVSGYALTFGLVLVPSGRLGDATGRRRMFLIGVTLFTVASLVAGLSPSAPVLVAARLVQGIGGGLLNPQITGLIQELFRGAERGKAYGLLGATIGISTAVGPVAGGLIIRLLGADDGWRWIFFVNLPIGLGAVLLAMRWLPGAPARTRSREDLDPVGVLLLGAGLAALLLPLVESGRGRGGTGWWAAVLGVALIGAWLTWERQYTARGHTPLVDLRLFQLPGYSTGAAVATIYFSGFTAIFFVLALYLQDGLGYSPLLSGLAITPFAAGSAVMSAVGGRIVTRFGRPLVTVGLVLVVVGLVVTDVVVGQVGSRDVGWWIALPLLVAGLGSGLVITPNITLTLAEVPVERGGTAGGVLQTGQRIGTAAGIALVGAVFFAGARSDGGYEAAVSLGLRVSTGLVAVALAFALVEVVVRRRRRPEADRSGSW